MKVANNYITRIFCLQTQMYRLLKDMKFYHVFDMKKKKKTQLILRGNRPLKFDCYYY